MKPIRGDNKTQLMMLTPSGQAGQNGQHKGLPAPAAEQQRPKARKQRSNPKKPSRSMAQPPSAHHQVIVLNGRGHRLSPHPAKLSGAFQRQRPRKLPATPASSKSRPTLGPHSQAQAEKSPPQEYTCFGCQKPIRDRFLLSACDKFWHDSCLKCDRCQARLGELGSSLYAKGNMNLCRQDYYEMFGQKAICVVCDKLICSSEMVMRARDNVYHLECFACQLCGLRFCVGDRFHLCENKIVCQYDYDEHIYPLQYQQQQQQPLLLAHQDYIQLQQDNVVVALADYQQEQAPQCDRILTPIGDFGQLPAQLALDYEQSSAIAYERLNPTEQREHDPGPAPLYHTLEGYTSRPAEAAAATVLAVASGAGPQADREPASPTATSEPKQTPSETNKEEESHERDPEVAEVAKMLVDQTVDKAETETGSAGALEPPVGDGDPK